MSDKTKRTKERTMTESNTLLQVYFSACTVCCSKPGTKPHSLYRVQLYFNSREHVA